jgi:hypothetical protein
MRAEQSELGAVMIEARQVLPILGSVAGLAADGCTVSAESFHALGELPVVRIFVASSARNILKMIDSGGVVARSLLGRGRLGLHGNRGWKQQRAGIGRSRFVTVGAQDGKMASREREAGLFVLGERER